MAEKKAPALRMKLYGLDTETHDPLLKDQGPSWVFGDGEVLVTGLYSAETRTKRSIDGNGGKIVRDMLLSASTAIVGAKIEYDLGWLCHEHGLTAKQTQCQLIDVAIAESLIDEYQPFSLDALAMKYLRERKGHEKLADIASKHRLKGDFRGHLKVLWYGDPVLGIPSYKQEVRDYVISDADQPVRIWEKQKLILEEQGLMPAFEMNMKMTRITTGMKQHGAPIDYDTWKVNCAIAKEAYDALSKTFTENYGEVNINSSKQMAVLYDKYKVPYKCKITVKGWAPEGRKFLTASDSFSGQEVYDQKEHLKSSFPGVRVMKGTVAKRRQLQVVLFVPSQYAERTNMQLARLGYQTSCNPSLGKNFFEATRASYQVVADVVEYKHVSDIITKFLGSNFERFMVQDKDGVWRVHGSLDPVGARQTGRLSSRQPQLQNIPSKTMLKLYKEFVEALIKKYGDKKYFVRKDGVLTGEINLAKMCREVFIAEKGHMFVKLDFSGQENVLQAHFAVGENGKRIRAMYTENPRLDEHQFVSDVSGLGEQHGPEIGRKYAKNVRFGLAYGMQVTRMCEQFGWDKDFAEELMEAVKDASPWVHETMQYLMAMLTASGDFAPGKPMAHLAKRYIRTIVGRRIHLREGMDRDAYAFYNYLVQGSASDMMKMALIAFAESDLDGFIILLLTIHDEGCFSVPMTPEGVAAVLILQQFFQGAVKLSIPINADPEAGTSWAWCHGQEKDKATKQFTESVQEMLVRVVAEIKAGELKTIEEEEDDYADFTIVDDNDDDDDEEEDE